MPHLTRTHTGIECSISQDRPNWKISIKYNLKGQTSSAKLIVRQTILDEAIRIADDEVKKSGHVCDGACTDWKVFSD